MKKESNESDQLFRRLQEYEIPVERDLWGELEKEIPLAVRHRKLWYTKMAAAASVLLILSAASAAFLFFSPQEELIEAFSQVATHQAATGTPQGDAVTIELPSLPPTAVAVPASLRQTTVPGPPYQTEEDSISFSFSMSVTISATSSTEEQTSPYREGWASYYTQSAGNYSREGNSPSEGNSMSKTRTTAKRQWSLQAAAGTALPADHGTYKMPLTAEVTVERELTDRLAVETGLRYSMLKSEEALHYIGIPVKLKYTCYHSQKIDLYATAGGIAEKCVAGAADNGFRAEPVQLGVIAGVGARYQLNDKLAFFVEPGVSHHFKTDSQTRTLRNERPTNFNLLCGVRMTY
ncbi:MAG: porin family protein [Bacteroides sp.]|nr:porin family protein [Bacteroides sp.]